MSELHLSQSGAHGAVATDWAESGADDPPYRLDCLEVWGGSVAIDSAVAVTGLDTWVWSQPLGSGRGGDVYLVSMCACASVSRFLVADVAGHGADASKVAVRLRRLMRRHINKPDQSRLAFAMNDDFDGMARYGRFATAILATFFPPTRQLMICNAGHPRPLVYRRAVGRWCGLEPSAAGTDSGNIPLGIRSKASFCQFDIVLEPQDLVLFYTDGLTEVAGADGTYLGESGLLELLSTLDAHAPTTLLPRLRSAIDQFAHGRPPRDDMTLLLLRANGAQPPPQGLVQKIRVMARMLGLVPEANQR